MRECEWCGIGIVTSRADARYCSPAHRVAAHRYRASKIDQIPRELKTRTRWIRHTASKVPITVTGTPASSTDPATWTNYQTAKSSQVGVGLGYVLGDGIGCIDLDHCLNNGEPSPAARNFIENYPDNWIEISPSGDGLHIWGTAPESPGTRRSVDGLSIETYTSRRYITVTGNTYRAGDLLPL